MSLKDVATNKNSSNLRYLLLIPFLVSWYNLLVFSLDLDEYSYLNYSWLNFPQTLSLIAISFAFFYFHRVDLRRIFLGSYLGLWLATVLGTLILDLVDEYRTRTFFETLIRNFGWPLSISDETNPLSAINSLFYSYNFYESDYQGSTVWSPNGGVGFSWLLLTLVTPIVIVLLINPFDKKIKLAEIQASSEPDFYDYPVATTQHRLAGIAVDAGLYVVTFGIGWMIWNLAIWNTGLTPGKQILKMRVYDFRTSRPATFGQMAKRQLLFPNVVGFCLIPVYFIATTLAITYPFGGASMYLLALAIAIGFFVFDLVVMFRDIKLRRFVDQLAGTVVLNEASNAYKGESA